MNTNTPVLELRDVHTSYGLVQALSGVTLRVDEGEIVTLIGANGAGKTTTLNAICGALPVKRGDILLNGRSVLGIPTDKVVRLGIGYVPERRQLFSSMSVLDNLLLGSYSRRGKDKEGEIREDLEAVFELFPILKERKGQIAGTLSGGQQQMVAIGRGLMSRPKLLMLDEPSLGLAPIPIREVMEVTSQLKQRGITVLLVEQNASAALTIADRGYVLVHGTVVKEGTASELLADEEVRSAYLGGVKR